MCNCSNIIIDILFIKPLKNIFCSIEKKAVRRKHAFFEPKDTEFNMDFNEFLFFIVGLKIV